MLTLLQFHRKLLLFRTNKLCKAVERLLASCLNVSANTRQQALLFNAYICTVMSNYNMHVLIVWYEKLNEKDRLKMSFFPVFSQIYSIIKQVVGEL